MLIIRTEVILLFIIVLSSIFVAMTIIIFSICVILGKSSKIIDKTTLKELNY